MFTINNPCCHKRPLLFSIYGVHFLCRGQDKINECEWFCWNMGSYKYWSSHPLAKGPIIYVLSLWLSHSCTLLSIIARGIMLGHDISLMFTFFLRLKWAWHVLLSKIMKMMKGTVKINVLVVICIPLTQITDKTINHSDTCVMLLLFHFYNKLIYVTDCWFPSSV